MAQSTSEPEFEGDMPFGEDLPLDVRRRVHALESLQKKRAEITALFRAEMLELERKYVGKYAPLNEMRSEIVNGMREPTEEELTGFGGTGVEEVNDNGNNVVPAEGIPMFWLTCLQNHPVVSNLITENDAEALKALKDVRVSYLADKPGFKLEFEFASNEFFSNTILTKEYHLANPEEGVQDDFVYDHAVGSEIKWKTGKNLCFKTVVRTQRHRQNNSTRTVKREEPQESFFHFFIPPTMPSEEEEIEEEDINELESRLQMDYEIGEIIKETIVPNAVDWFTGKALEYEELEDDEFYGEDDDDLDYDEEEDDDEEDEESEEENARRPSKPGVTRRNQGPGAASGSEKPECKQQ